MLGGPAVVEIKPLTAIGANRALCQHQVHVVANLATNAARRGAYQRERIGVPVDQCGKRGDFTFAGVVLCRAHAALEALRILLAGQPRTNAQEIALPRCGCGSETVRRVLIENGVCGRGGCPYGGDF